MRVLIVGGTRFVGRHITGAALAGGHEVTLLHRGRTGAELFPAAEHLLLDRDGDLGALRGRRWDTVIDVSAYRPRQVRSLAGALRGGAGRYVFISSVSVYRPPAAPGYDESSPVHELPAGAEVPEEITEETYGALKVLCERAAVEEFGPDTFVVRPGFVAGPFDHLGRFTHWVRRLARGGEVLAPGLPDRPIQLVDARDLAAFTLVPARGTFHAVTPPTTFGAFLEDLAAAVAPPGTTLTWVDPRFLLDAGETADTLPLWYAGDEGEALLNTADPSAARAAGLRLRPVAESARDVVAEPPVPGFLPADREADLLTRWAATRTS